MEINELPYISVIIIAYNRKEYLLDAIKSVINQTLDKKYYEIIVIKNFYDDNIDAFATKNNIINLFSENQMLSGKIVEGIKKAKGNILCFLEDDDLFANNKLEIVYNKFKNKNNLCFYHNDNIPVDEKYEKLGRDINRGIAFNISSMSIKKEIINIDNLKRIDFYMDHFMYLSALESNKKIIKGKEKLTHYMYHNSASNYITTDFNEFKKYRASLQENNIRNFTALKEIFTSKKATNHLDGKIANEEIDNYLFCANKKPDNLMNIFKSKERPAHIRMELFLLYIFIRMHNNFRYVIIKRIFNDIRKI